MDACLGCCLMFLRAATAAVASPGCIPLLCLGLATYPTNSTCLTSLSRAGGTMRGGCRICIGAGKENSDSSLACRIRHGLLLPQVPEGSSSCGGLQGGEQGGSSRLVLGLATYPAKSRVYTDEQCNVRYGICYGNVIVWHICFMQMPGLVSAHTTVYMLCAGASHVADIAGFQVTKLAILA